MPLIRRETIARLAEVTAQRMRVATVLTTEVDDPAGYGRIVRDEDGGICAIVEERDTTPEQKRIREINSSVYCFESKALLRCLDRLTADNNQQQYYLTDCIEMLVKEGRRVGTQRAPAEECMGVNTRAQLAAAERAMRRRINERHMENGVHLIDPENTYIGYDAFIDPDVVIYPGNVIEGDAQIGEMTLLYPGNFIEGAIIGAGNRIGPNAHLRPGCVIGRSCRIGNFVELKNISLDDGAHVSHLAYCGDGQIGKKANISCGVIFSNYDGFRKQQTVVGDNAFVGCNVNLVAPVNIGDNAYIAAGSTITEDVPAGSLGIARGKQVNKEGWTQKFRERNKK